MSGRPSAKGGGSAGGAGPGPGPIGGLGQLFSTLFGRRERFSLEELAHLYDSLARVSAITDANKASDRALEKAGVHVGAGRRAGEPSWWNGRAAREAGRRPAPQPGLVRASLPSPRHVSRPACRDHAAKRGALDRPFPWEYGRCPPGRGCPALGHKRRTIRAATAFLYAIRLTRPHPPVFGPHALLRR